MSCYTTSNTTTGKNDIHLSPETIAKLTNDDLSWMQSLDEFIFDEERAVQNQATLSSIGDSKAQTPVMNPCPNIAVTASYPSNDIMESHKNSNKRLLEEVMNSKDKAARKRIREKERRDQLNSAYKRLNTLMMEVDPTYKCQIPFTSNHGGGSVNQPYLISKTISKIRSLCDSHNEKKTEIEKIETKITFIKSGEVPDTADEELKEKLEEEKKMQQQMQYMMMMPMMITPNGMGVMMGGTGMMNVMGMAMNPVVSEKGDVNVSSTSDDNAQKQGNLAHCA